MSPDHGLDDERTNPVLKGDRSARGVPGAALWRATALLTEMEVFVPLFGRKTMCLAGLGARVLEDDSQVRAGLAHGAVRMAGGHHRGVFAPHGLDRKAVVVAQIGRS